MSKSVFVTVGSTEFDGLIELISSPFTLETLAALGFDNLTIQYGRGSLVPPKASPEHPLKISSYKYKDSLADDYSTADLIISHAGAGTCTEVLALRKPLIVVVNETLHDNHQFELARQLAQDGHLFYCTPSTLVETLKERLTEWPPSLTAFEPGKPEVFANWLVDTLGLLR